MRRRAAWALAGTALVLAACSAPAAQGTSAAPPAGTTSSRATPSTSTPASGSPQAEAGPTTIPGMPPVTDPTDVYAADGPGMLSDVVRGDRPMVYVPNSGSDTVTEIDPRTYRVVRTFRVGHQPQHVVPSHDLRTLWVNNDLGDSLTPIDPRTGRAGRPVHVDDPYNLYFTPDGRYAVVMASMLHRLDFRDPRTMRLEHSVHVPCAGVNHADWTADGSHFLVSCEFSGQLLWVDTLAQKVEKVIDLPNGSMPQDVKLSPDGSRFFVADMANDGVWIYDVTPKGPRLQRLMKTGKGAHGLYVSRDATRLYVSDREAGAISVIRFRDEKIVARWRIPGGGSPDMGNLSPDGRVLWLSGRYDGVVYAIDTRNGHLLAKIRVGTQPHGLTVWPQPGRYSLGHTGIMR